MKTTSLMIVAGMLAFTGITWAEEAAEKPKKEPKPLAPEILEKYDKDKDGKLNKEEKAEMAKAKAAEPKPEKQPKEAKPIAPEILAKYDADKDGKLSKDEKAAMKKDEPAKPKPEKEKKPKTATEPAAEDFGQ